MQISAAAENACHVAVQGGQVLLLRYNKNKSLKFRSFAEVLVLCNGTIATLETPKSEIEKNLYPGFLLDPAFFYSALHFKVKCFRLPANNAK